MHNYYCMHRLHWCHSAILTEAISSIDISSISITLWLNETQSSCPSPSCRQQHTSSTALNCCFSAVRKQPREMNEHLTSGESLFRSLVLLFIGEAALLVVGN